MNYHDDLGSISKSMLNDFIEDRELYKLRYIDRVLPWKPATKAMQVGTIVHAWLLEGKPVISMARVIPETCLNVNGDIIGARLAKLRKANPGLMFMKSSEFDDLLDLCVKIKESPLYDAVSKAKYREQRFDWLDGYVGLKCKCKPDFVIDAGDRIECHDVKVTNSASPWLFGRVADRFRYWLQDAHYSVGLEKNFGKPVDFYFWVIEDRLPYRIVKRWYSEEDRQLAKETRQKRMLELAACFDSGDWSNDWPDEIPAWGLKRAEDNELVDVEFAAETNETFEF